MTIAEFRNRTPKPVQCDECGAQVGTEKQLDRGIMVRDDTGRFPVCTGCYNTHKDYFKV